MRFLFQIFICEHSFVPASFIFIEYTQRTNKHTLTYIPSALTYIFLSVSKDAAVTK